MKRIALFICLLGAMVSCKGLTGVDETSRDWKIEGSTMTWGEHSYTLAGVVTEPEFDKDGVMISAAPKTAEAVVTFTHNPEGYNEFSTVYREFLGKSKEGAAAMLPMAMELYGRNRLTGERCLQLLCGSLGAQDVIRELGSKMYRSTYSPTTDLYVQRYLPAALLKGAVPENAYTPIEPYTVELWRSNNRPQGDYCYLSIYGAGWDTSLRGVELKQNGSHYIVNNCPACYSQCKTIKGEWSGIK